MRNHAGFFGIPIKETGPRCVWVRVRDEKGTRLVARWIAPQAEADTQHEKAESHDEVQVFQDEEARYTWLGICLHFA